MAKKRQRCIDYLGQNLKFDDNNKDINGNNLYEEISVLQHFHWNAKKK